MAEKPCPDCGQAVPVDAARCRFCGHDFSGERPAGVPMTLRQRFRSGAGPDDFTDRELAWLQVAYTRWLLLAIVAVIVASAIGGLAVYLAG